MFKSSLAKSLLLSLGLSSVAVAQDGDQVQVTTVDQQVVVVSKTEVLRAYGVVTRQKSKNFSASFTNDDGSVTLVEPRFKFRGADVPFFGTKDIAGDVASAHLLGVCRLYGFGSAVTFTPADFVSERAFMNSNGTLAVVSKGGTSQSEAIKDITCR